MLLLGPDGSSFTLSWDADTPSVENVCCDSPDTIYLHVKPGTNFQNTFGL